MILLIVKQPGLMLSPPGVQPFRTPAEVNITKCDINLITNYLRAQGVDQYRILSNEEDILFDEIQEKPKPKEDPDIANKLENIERLIQELKDQPTPDPTTKVVYKDIEEVDEFIPSIDTGDLKVSGTSIHREEKDDITNNVAKLKKLKK